MQRDFVKASERTCDISKKSIKEKILKIINKNKRVKYVKPRIIYKNISFI